MMCLMHEGTPYGHLTVMGRSLPPESLARLVGESASAVKRWLRELSDNEVYSTTEEGVIYSRRMLRDEAIREARAEGGKAGSEHGKKGASHGSQGGRPRIEKTPLSVDVEGGLKPPPSSSSSSSSPSPSSEDLSADALAKNDFGNEFRLEMGDEPEPVILLPEHVVEAWNAMAARHGLAKVAKLTEARRKKLNARIAQHPIEDFTAAIAAIERSPFCLGNSREGWRADFDFLLQPSSFVKLIEGSYDRG